MRTTLRGRRWGRPSPAMVVAVLALVMATAGTATAARVLITSSAQIRAGSVTGSDIRKGSVTSSDLNDGTIRERDIRNGAVSSEKLDRAARQALASSAVKATEVFRRTGPVDQPQGKVVRVITMQSLDPGVYAIFAKTTLTAEPPEADLLRSGESNSGHCVLDAGGDKDDARTILGGPGFNSPATLNLQITRTFSERAPVTLDCDANMTQWRASDTTLIAIRLSAAPKVAVDG